jgi:hypothetical protein
LKKELREPPDIAQFFIALDHHRIRYVLFGTVGLIAYGARVSTGDLDICPAPDQDNLEHLAVLLTAIQAIPRYVSGFNTREECEQWQPHPLQVETFDHLFQTMLGDLDVVPAPYGPHGKTDRFSYERLQERAVTKSIFGLHIRVAAFEDLLASKLSGQREKDLRIAPELERLREQQAQGGQTGWPIVEM